MAEGKLMGIRRPFVEEEEKPIRLIYEFTDAIVKKELREKAQVIEGALDKKGIRTSSIEIDAGINNFIIAELRTTNLDIQSIEDARDIGFGISGYKNLIVSSVPHTNIVRLKEKR